MRKFMLALATTASLSLGLSGCGTTIGGITLPTAAQVQAEAQLLCGFIPAAADVATLIASMAGAGALVVTAAGVANAICAQVNTPTVSGKFRVSMPSKVIVNGVVVHRAK